MKIKDFISENIQSYPSLFKDVDYEKSKLKVLGNIFFTIDNGLDFAKTENPEDGGYLTYPKYQTIENKQVRIFDRPYGRKKYKPLPKDYFDSVVYYVFSGLPLLEVIGDGRYVHFRYGKSDVKNKLLQPRLVEAKSEHLFEPSPFLAPFSLFNRIINEDIFLQNDWMEELILLCERTIEYYSDEEQYKHHIYYPVGDKLEKDDIDTWNQFHKQSLNLLNNFLQKNKK